MLLLELFVYAYGTCVFLAVVLSARRRSGPGRTALGQGRPQFDWLDVTLCLLATAWFATLLLLTLASVVHAPPPAAHRVLLSLYLALAFAFPPLLMHSGEHEARRRAGDTGAARPSLAVLGMYAYASAASLGTLAGFWRLWPWRPSAATIAVLLAAGFVAAATWSAFTAAKRRPVEEAPPQKRRRVAETVLFVVLALAFVPLLLRTAGWAVPEGAARLVAQSMPLAFLFGGAWFESRFEFFDVVVKRGAALLVTMVVVGAGALAGTELALAVREADAWVRPWIVALSVLPGALALPWLIGRTGTWLDRQWFGRQWTPAEAVRAVVGAADGPQTVDHFRERLAGVLGRILDADVRVSPAPPACTGAGLLVPVRVQGRPEAWILVAARANGRPLLSEDVQLVESLGEVAGRLLHLIGVQESHLADEQRAHRLALAARAAELRALRAQINPHFLFNALNAVAGLVHTDPAAADRTVERLAAVFRYTLRAADREWARVDEELEFARAYFDVERARFGPRFLARIEAAAEALPLLVPSLAIQTLVENAVKHGAARVVGGPAIVDVTVTTADEDLVVRVTDNGPGPLAAPSAAGHGLRNVRERLHGYFGDRASLAVARDGDRDRTVASLSLPVVHDRPPAPAGAAVQEAV